MRLVDIAGKITTHLKRWEADPAINTAIGTSGTRRYFMARAWASGRFVYVSYVTYQGASHLTKDEALQYLAWIEAGNVGRHYGALKARQC